MARAHLYRDRIARGICVECGCKSAAEGYRMCADCRAERRARLDALIELRICTNCGSERAMPDIQTCQTCTEARRERVSRRNEKRRQERKCVECGRPTRREYKGVREVQATAPDVQARGLSRSPTRQDKGNTMTKTKTKMNTIPARITRTIWGHMQASRHASEYYYTPGYALAGAAYEALRRAGWKRTSFHDGVTLYVMGDIHWLSGTNPRLFYCETDSQMGSGKAHPLLPMDRIAEWIAAAHVKDFEFRPLSFEIGPPEEKPKSVNSPLGGFPPDARESLALR